MRGTSIDKDEHGGLLGGFDGLLKLPLLRLRLFQLRRHFRHGFQEREGRLPRRPHIRDAVERVPPSTLPRSSTNAPPELSGCTGTLIWKYRASSPSAGERR